MGFREEFNGLIAPAEVVLDEDLPSLSRWSPERRRKEYNEIKENEEEFKFEFRQDWRDHLDKNTIQDTTGRFATARLFLHVASLRDEGAQPLAPDAFSSDEIEAAREFDHYRAFDISNQQDLERRIRERDDEIYEFVVEEIVTQAEEHEGVLESQHNEIRGDIMHYLNRKYKARREKAQDAVSLYIEHHGLPNVIDSVESAVEATADGVATRKAVEEAVESAMEDLSGRLHASLAEQERVLRSDLAALEASFGSQDVEVDVDVTDLESKLDQLNERIETFRAEQRADTAALEEAIEELSERRSELDEQIRELESTSADAAEAAAETAAESVAEDAKSVISAELEQLRERREELEAELNRLSRERERLEAAGDRLETERSSLRERLDSLDESLPEGSGPSDVADETSAVPAEVARLYELDFIGRFDQSVAEADHLVLPDGSSMEVDESFWRDSNESGELRGEMQSLLSEHGHDPETVDQYPLRRYSRYTAVTSGRFSINYESKLVVEAGVYSNLDAYAANGFDASPAGLSDLLDIVNRAIERAELYDTPHLLGVASTTGWTDKVRNLVTEEEFARTRFSDQVSLCLVDLRTGELLYDRSDDLIHRNRRLFERAVRAERVDACIEDIRSEYLSDPMRDILRLEEVIEESDYPAHIVKSAFERISAADDVVHGHHEEHGAYLHLNP